MKRSTWYWIPLSGLSILLVSSVMACTPPSSSAPTTQPPSTEQPEQKPAQFEVSEVSVESGTTMVGHPATVIATVTNSGGSAGAYTACLMVDGQEIERKDVSVAPGASAEVSFHVTKTSAGNYKLSVGESSTLLDVYDWVPQTIQYDVGTYNIQIIGTYIYGGGGHIVHFTPLALPFKIQKISISASTNVKNVADLSERMFTVRIWNEHKTQQLWSDEFPWSLFPGEGGWQDIDVPDVIVDGDFHVEIVTNSDEPPSKEYMAIRFEESKDESRSGISWMGQVGRGSYAVEGKRWLIRVKGEGPPTTLVQEEDQTEVTTELIIPSPKLVYEDNFSDPDSGWEQTSGEEADYYYRDGEFHVLVKVEDRWVWRYNQNAGRFRDFIIEGDARLVSGSKYTVYGLIFRCKDNNNFYTFLISADGRYQVGKLLIGMSSWLHGVTGSAFIETGNRTNRLKVVCKNSQIEVFANGHHLTTVVDDSFVDGYVGMVIYAYEPDTHVAFDNFKVYSPSPETP
ncbi:MAG: hypothetical protein JSV54_03005 [Chloroflexota bacterium]|nr:MAG: hypothetical protein JSV54_03005 [Chloroflexota bacterium]